MHMADALLSPAVGGVMWAATAATTIYCARKVHRTLDERRVPMMGVLGAFIFAAQMINFTIPGTGSSGHLGGGLLLAILLGPHAAFLTIASVLTVQALFFADGGLLALGCNAFNMGFFACFVAYPLIYRPLVGASLNSSRISFAATVAAVAGLLMGAFGVVLETTASGISELPFGKFVLLMLPIHFAIGIVEGLVTAAVASFVWKARPEVLETAAESKPLGQAAMGKVMVVLLLAAVVTGGALSWFASAYPDGLEWSMFRTSGKEELDAPVNPVFAVAESIQEKTAFMPDYGFKETEETATDETPVETENAESWPAVSAGASIAGLVGGAITLALAGLIGMVLRMRPAM